MSQSSPEGIILGPGSKLISYELSIDKKKVLSNEPKKKYLHKIHIEDHIFDDLDIRLHDEIGLDYDNNEQYEIIEVGQGQAYGYVIRIDQMIEKLVELNSKGATHVEINHDEDHIGYDISGFILRPSTPNEIEEYEGIQRVRREKEEKRMDLIRQLAELDQEREAVSKDKYEDLPF